MDVYTSISWFRGVVLDILCCIVSFGPFLCIKLVKKNMHPIYWQYKWILTSMNNYYALDYWFVDDHMWCVFNNKCHGVSLTMTASCHGGMGNFFGEYFWQYGTFLFVLWTAFCLHFTCIIIMCSLCALCLRF